METVLEDRVRNILDPEKQYRKKEYRQYLASPKWAQKKKEAIERAQGKCQLCNSPSQLQVHHRTYERAGEELPQDLTVLCGDCHYWFHKVRFGPKVKVVSPPPEKIYIVKKGADRAEAFKVPVPEKEPLLKQKSLVEGYLLRNKWGDLPQQNKDTDSKLSKKKCRKGTRFYIRPGRTVPGSSPYLPRKVSKGEI